MSMFDTAGQARKRRYTIERNVRNTETVYSRSMSALESLIRKYGNNLPQITNLCSGNNWLRFSTEGDANAERTGM
jgi:hypothetical protein